MNILKKAKRVLAVLLIVSMFAVVLPFNALAATSPNVQIIYNFVVTEMGLNSAAACGILANIEMESNFSCTVYGDNGSSYGICQWHNTKFTELKNYCNANGYDWQGIEGQLQFLKYDLNNNKRDSASIIDKLRAVENSADGAYDAGYQWCYYYERPSNKATKAEKRGTNARDKYWVKYGNTDPIASKGDVNFDGKVNSADALLIVQAATKSKTLSTLQQSAADMNKDKRVTSADALIILNIATGADSIKKYQ